MVFCSPVFLFLFLPLVLGSYFVAPRSLRNPVLLAASLFFYLWGEKIFILVLLGSITVNYLLGLWIERVRGRWTARAVLGLAVLVNLGALAWFKYAHFLVDNLNLLLTRWQQPPCQLEAVHLPLGVSFFTFHALSYVIDVYRREEPALKNPIQFALYISFFPQAIAGPIVRYGEVVSQLARRALTLEGFAEGVRRFILGLAKKMIVANTLAAPADAIFGLPEGELTAGLAWLGAVCYTLQIYFDFSGYSDMAIGLARLFGFRFPENFNYPYAAGSVTDFWRCWHVSLSTWFRDYLYIPLGGGRVGTVRLYGNLVLVFFLCGLWHGASWSFIAWGLFHGAFLVVERTSAGQWLRGAWSPVRHGYTLVVVIAGWVLFRAANLTQALTFLSAMAGFGTGGGMEFYPSLYWGMEVTLALIAGAAASAPVWTYLAQLSQNYAGSGFGRSRIALWLEPIHALAPVLFLGLLFLVSGMLLAGGTYNPFIYFRF